MTIGARMLDALGARVQMLLVAVVAATAMFCSLSSPADASTAFTYAYDTSTGVAGTQPTPGRVVLCPRDHVANEAESPGHGYDTASNLARTSARAKAGSCAPQAGGGWLYRSMKAAADGLPEVGATARTLGVRRGTDISVDGAGVVHSGTGGMSVTPDDPMGLPDHRRPPECGGGAGRDPVFRILRSALGRDPSYRPDPANPTGHGFVEPARTMSIDDFQGALAVTRGRWGRVVF